MSHFPKHGIQHLRGVLTLRTLAAATPNCLLAAGFLVLLKAEILGASLKLLGGPLLCDWAVVEALAIWTVPVLYFAHRFFGKRIVSLSVCGMVPTLIAALFASGYLSGSVKIFRPGLCPRIRVFICADSPARDGANSAEAASRRLLLFLDPGCAGSRLDCSVTASTAQRLLRALSTRRRFGLLSEVGSDDASCRPVEVNGFYGRLKLVSAVEETVVSDEDS